MITTPTVLVLGAGASVPYGFPSGLRLLEEIDTSLKNVNHPWWNIVEHLEIPREEVSYFLQELLFSGQQSVDAFLEHRNEFLKVGKLIIAITIASHEFEPNLIALSNRRRSFYHYLFAKLNASRETFGENQLSIVTFNYDRSIEQFFYLSIKHSWNISDEECRDKISNIPIIHVHGSLGLLPWQGDKFHAYSRNYSPEDIQFSSEQIIVISEGQETSQEFTHAFQLMEQAKRIYFLGFGYNNTNLKRLGINKLPQELKRPLHVIGSHSPMQGTSLGMGFVDIKQVESDWGIELPDGTMDCLDFLETYALLS